MGFFRYRGVRRLAGLSLVVSAYGLGSIGGLRWVVLVALFALASFVTRHQPVARSSSPKLTLIVGGRESPPPPTRARADWCERAAEAPAGRWS